MSHKLDSCSGVETTSARFKLSDRRSGDSLGSVGGGTESATFDRLADIPFRYGLLEDGAVDP